MKLKAFVFNIELMFFQVMIFGEETDRDPLFHLGLRHTSAVVIYEKKFQKSWAGI